MDKWVSVKDQLPDHVKDDVWAYDEEEGVVMAHYFRGHWSSTHDAHNPDTYYHVTHWQTVDIPEPPEMKVT